MPHVLVATAVNGNRNTHETHTADTCEQTQSADGGIASPSADRAQQLNDRNEVNAARRFPILSAAEETPSQNASRHRVISLDF